MEAAVVLSFAEHLPDLIRLNKADTIFGFKHYNKKDENDATWQALISATAVSDLTLRERPRLALNVCTQ